MAGWVVKTLFDKGAVSPVFVYPALVAAQVSLFFLGRHRRDLKGTATRTGSSPFSGDWSQRQAGQDEMLTSPKRAG